MSKLEKYDNRAHRIYTGKSEIDKALHTLEGLLIGINLDNSLNTAELNELKNWCESYSIFVNKQPIGEILTIVQAAIEDGIVDENERDDILWLCNNYRTGSVYYDAITSDIQRLGGILHGILADGVISDNEIITSCGGTYHDSVVKNTDYLVIGNDGNPCWAFSCYGRKVEQAVKLRRKGHKIIIVHENDFWDALADLG